MLVSEISKTILPNGVQIVCAPMPGILSASIGLWVDVGSRDDPADAPGLCHLIEHSLARGTRSRHENEIADLADHLGGELNPFTNREFMCIFAKVRDNESLSALELILDLFLEPSLSESAVGAEKAVIADEIARSRDMGEQSIYELLLRVAFPDQPLGRSVLGERSSIMTIAPSAPREFFYEECHQGSRVSLVAAGGIDPEAILQATQSLRQLDEGAPVWRNSARPFLGGTRQHQSSSLSQAHVAVGVPSTAMSGESRYSSDAVAAVIGATMSGTFVREVRDVRSLSYEAYAFQDHFSDAGLLTLYASTSPEAMSTVVDIAVSSLMRLKKAGIRQSDIERVKCYLAARAVLDFDAGSAWLERFGRQLLQSEMPMGPREIAATYEGLTATQVNEVIDSLPMETPLVLALSPG